MKKIDNPTNRITFIIGSMGKGGAERVISILANDYALREWKVDIIMLLANTCEYDLNEDINLIAVGRSGKSYISQVPRWIFFLRSYIADKKPDKIVSFVARINLLTLLSNIGHKNSVLISERNDPKNDGRSIVIKMLTYILYPSANKIIFQTKWAKNCFPLNIREKGQIIPNPISVNTEVSFIKEKKIVAVGRLTNQKNHELLIKSFYHFLKINPHYELYIYGEGELRKKLSILIEDLNITQNVFLPGIVSNIHEKISDAEMFILSSDYEGLSNAMLEAMMMGIPCISTNCAGSNEIIDNEKNGLLIEIGSEKELLNAMFTLANDQEFSLKLGKNGKRDVQFLKTEKVISQWKDAIEK